MVSSPMKYLGLKLRCLSLILGLCNSYLSMSEQQKEDLLFGYDQYETCVPLRRAGTCVRQGWLFTRGQGDSLVPSYTRRSASLSAVFLLTVDPYTHDSNPRSKS